MFRFGMIPTRNKPTRQHITRHIATAIHHVFTNSIMGNMEIKTAIVKTDISDHLQKTKQTLKLQSNIILNVIFQTSQSINW